MKDLLTNPTVLKIAATLAAVAVYVLAHKIPELKDVLQPLAGGLAGSALISRPGDAPKKEGSE
jgi:hypothetical protein